MYPDTNAALTRLQGLLQTVFQFDRSDLDFGIYRILNTKRGDIEKFINDILPKLVTEALAASEQVKRSDIEAQLAASRDEITRVLGDSALAVGGELSTQFNDTPLGRKYLETKAALSRGDESSDAQTAAYNALYAFFARYYEEGDFIAKRRFGQVDKYVVPSHGEDSRLYWATDGEYYSKSLEVSGSYRFNAADFTVIFEVPETLDSESAPLFVTLAEADPVSFDSDERLLRVKFERRLLDEKERAEISSRTAASKQRALNRRSEEALKSKIQDTNLLGALFPTTGSSAFSKHLDSFSAEMTSGFFVHRHLEPFLRRELDFFLKNEVVLLDELLATDDKVFAVRLRTSKVVRTVAESLIQLLAQVQSFQKRIFEKKPFVVRSNWCVTLDRIPESMWDEIVANKEQLAEWGALFFLELSAGEIPDNAFLTSHPSLIIDTRYFNADFKWRLLGALGDLEQARDGIILCRDAFRSVNLIRQRYRGHVKLAYADPLYNTGSDGFAFKPGYQHSSWLSMMSAQASLARDLLRQDGAIFVSVDDHEAFRCQLMLNQLFGEDNFLCGFVWEKRYAPPPDSKTKLGYVHELILAYRASAIFRRNLLPLTEAQRARYTNLDKDTRGDWKSADYTCRYTKQEREHLYYPIKHPKTGEDVWPKETRVWAYSQEEHQKNVQENRVWWGENQENTVPAYKSFVTEIEQGFKPTTLLKHEEVGHSDEAAKELRAVLPGIKHAAKPIRLLERLITIASNEDSVILDLFGNVGPTPLAVLKLNREGGQRRYVVIGTDAETDELLFRRLKKSIYSTDWEEGKPIGETGASHVFEYIDVESFEDSLNNLEIDTSGSQKMLEAFGADYVLKYMLSFDTKGSPSLGKIEGFADPFEYNMVVSRDGAISTVNVDLVETFNWLLGVSVKTVGQFEDDGRVYRAVRGTTNGTSVLIVWRRVSDIQQDPDALLRDKQFMQDSIFPAMMTGSVPERLFVNGPSFVPDAQNTEAEFTRLMFAAEFA